MVLTGSEVNLFCMFNEACILFNIHYTTKFYLHHFWSQLVNHNVRYADFYREMMRF